jgi:hypothetical protein
MYNTFINSKIGYDYHRLSTSYDIVDVNYEGKTGSEISNIYTLKVLKEIIELYKTLLKNVESDLMSVRGKVVLVINRDFNSIKPKFENMPLKLQQKVKKLLMKNCSLCN